MSKLVDKLLEEISSEDEF